MSHSGHSPWVSRSVPTVRSETVPALYSTIRAAVRPLLERLFDFHVSGLEHVPPRGPVIVAANHVNYLDGVVLGAALPRQIVFLVMPRVFRATPLHPYFHRRVGSIKIEVDRPDPVAFRRALRLLDRGGVLGIFPEGPFGRSGTLVRGQPGVGLLALRAGVPVVPAAILGTGEALAGRRFHIPRRVPFHVRFGAPLCFPRVGHRPLTQPLREDVTRSIMTGIAALLDPDPTPALAGSH